jgi:hypothetical protein
MFSIIPTIAIIILNTLKRLEHEIQTLLFLCQVGLNFKLRVGITFFDFG